MLDTYHLRRLAVVGVAIALPACALAAIGVDIADQRATEVSASAVDPSSFPLAADQPLFAGAGAPGERTTSGQQEADGPLHQRVVIVVNDSTSSTSSTEPPPTPPTTAPVPTTTVQVLGGAIAPPAPAVPGPTRYTG